MGSERSGQSKAGREPESKRAYCAPKLRLLGTVRELTLNSQQGSATDVRGRLKKSP
jgi:hypothetical protein